MILGIKKLALRPDTLQPRLRARIALPSICNYVSSRYFRRNGPRAGAGSFNIELTEPRSKARQRHRASDHEQVAASGYEQVAASGYEQVAASGYEKTGAGHEEQTDATAPERAGANDRQRASSSSVRWRAGAANRETS